MTDRHAARTTDGRQPEHASICLDVPLLDLYHSASGERPLSVEEFETLGLQRAKLYQKIVAMTDIHTIDTVIREITSSLDETFPLGTGEERFNDHHAHFVARLACGSARDLTHTFVRCEALILEARMKRFDESWQRFFVEKWIGSKYPQKMAPILCATAAGGLRGRVEREQAHSQGEEDVGLCWVVPFEECTQLVAQRRVVLQGGSAFVPSVDLFFPQRASADFATTLHGRMAFSLLRQAFVAELQQAAAISSRARALFDTNPNTRHLLQAVQLIEKTVRAPYVGDPRSARHRRRKSLSFGTGAVEDGHSQSPDVPNDTESAVGADKPMAAAESAAAEDPLCGAIMSTERFELDVELLRNPSLWRCFPPCMFRMVQHLDTTHHLKYDARVQLMVFLRSIGLPLRDALTFLRTEFARDDTMTQARYSRKRYEYCVRHIYGKEGRGVPWPNRKCHQIQKSVSGVKSFSSTRQSTQDRVHGCPFVTSANAGSLSDLVQTQCHTSDHAAVDIEDTASSSATRASGDVGHHVDTMAKLAKHKPNLACQYHFALNLDLLRRQGAAEVDFDGLDADFERDELAQAIPSRYLRAIRAVGIGASPTSYFSSAVSVLRARQRLEAATPSSS